MLVRWPSSSLSGGMGVHVTPVVDTPEQTAVNRTLVHDDRVLLIITAVTHDCHDGVLTGGKFTESEVFRGPSGDERFWG